MDAKQKSAFSGFMDGYKAGNISAVSTSLEVHEDKIKDLLKSLINGLKEEGGDIDLIKDLHKNLDLIDSNREIIDKLLAFGESLRSDLLFYEQDFSKKEIKKIIYHYIQLAKLIKDRDLTEKAIDLGNQVSK